MASQSTAPLRDESVEDDDLNHLENDVLTGPDSDSGPSNSASKRKQKRNKPTLSCGECVERKTKVSQYQSPYQFTYVDTHVVRPCQTLMFGMRKASNSMSIL
jgi:hypothetical protein